MNKKKMRLKPSHSEVFLPMRYEMALICPAEPTRQTKKTGKVALDGVAQWTEHWPVNQGVTGLIPSQGTCLVAGQ